MTDEKKTADDKDPKKVFDDELKDVDGGSAKSSHSGSRGGVDALQMERERRGGLY